MLYSLEQTLANRPPLTTIRHDAPLLDAFRLIIERRLGQLPVVDAEGRLRGIVSQQTLLGLYAMTDGAVSLFDLQVVDAMEPAVTLTPQDDLLAAVDRLRQRGTYAVVVADGPRPIGILTGKDMSVFFRSLFEGILLVERVERYFAAAIRSVYPTETGYNQALIAAFGPDKSEPTKPQNAGRELSLTDMTYLVRDDDNWPQFAALFGNRDYFRKLMDQTRHVRNQIAHFDGHVDALEMDTLRRAVTWLENRLELFAHPPGAPGERVDGIQALAAVVAGRKPPVCVGPDALLRDALRVMIENRFGQLPVLDEHGHLLGLVSQQSILRTYYHTEGQVDLLSLPVTHCVEPVDVLHPSDDLFRTADLLAQPGTHTPVVVEDDRPIAILTGKDMTHFFRSLFEGIILVERIEIRLRDYASAAFPDSETLNEAARRVFGPGPKNPEYPARNPKHFTFADRMLFMCDNEIWPVFAPALESREVFMQLMDRARRVRNALMHFRGNLSHSELDALRKAHSWLGQRPLSGPAALPPLPDDVPQRGSGSNPYGAVMARKARTLSAGSAEPSTP